jgi:hypothetical protein
MSGQVTLRYHAWTFRLLGREPRVSADAVRTIENWDAQHGLKLPAAVREWYSLEGIEDILAAVCPGHRVIPLAQFLASFARVARHKQNGPPQPLVFSPWPASAAPAVYLVLEGMDDPLITPVPGDWRAARPLSKVLADLAWGKVTAGRPSLVAGSIIDSRTAEFGPPQFDFLLETFPQMKRSWSHPPSIRFFGPGTWVQVHPQGDPSDGPCPAFYNLWADMEEQLLDLYDLVWPCHGTPVQLSPVDVAGYEDLVARFFARCQARSLSAEVSHIKLRTGAVW